MKQHTMTRGQLIGVIGHLLLAAWLMATPAQADSPLDTLPAVTTPAGTDLYYCVQAATDYKCTLDQMRQWTNVDITGGTVNGLVSLGIGATPVNKLDVEGAAVIGATYAGAQTAPTNGLLVEGNTAFGNATPLSRNRVTIQDTAAEAFAAALSVSQTSGDYSNAFGAYLNHTSSPAVPGAYNKHAFYSQIMSTVGSTVDNSGALYAFRSNAYHQANSTLGSAYGGFINVGTYAGGAGTTGTLANAYGLWVQGEKTTGSTITQATGIRIFNMQGDSVFGLYIGSSTGTNVYDVYASTAGSKNYFAGNVGIGTPSALHPLEARLDGAGFQTIIALENLQAAAADVGPRLMLEGAGNTDMFSVQSGWDGAATTDAYASFSVRGSSAVTERMRLTSAGKLGVGTNAPTELLDVNSNSIRVRTAKTPASATDTCDQGEISWDASYIYVCVATNSWTRAAMAAW
ncbi:MAG: hypothetical protein OEZ04_02545 [Nitrospinota bacterium]|nr:hypothetical protein [Nitrospinota bacterium]